jgi:hypothetical protein
MTIPGQRHALGEPAVSGFPVFVQQQVSKFQGFKVSKKESMMARFVFLGSMTLSGEISSEFQECKNESDYFETLKL